MDSKELDIIHAEHQESSGINPHCPVIIDEKHGLAATEVDMGATWLESYTGERGEITDEENSRLRRKVSGSDGSGLEDRQAVVPNRSLRRSP
jgi:hypothetical protein